MCLAIFLQKVGFVRNRIKALICAKVNRKEKQSVKTPWILSGSKNHS